jgi:16S rRNA (adenine1518-N6/adenine1519-N6)-dimethyltransferase
MVEVLDLKPEDTVIEIGPGDGMVTNIALAKGSKVIAVEIDYDLIPNLVKRFGDEKLFGLLHEDIMRLDINNVLEKRKVEKLKVVGSLPYNISKRIIDKFINFNIERLDIENKMPVEAMSFIVQEEVAKSYTALAPQSTFISNYVHLFCDVRKYESIPARQFFPMPKVNGGIILFKFKKEFPANYKEIIKLMRIGFASPRKTLRKNLTNSTRWAPEIIDAVLKEMAFEEHVRPAEIENEKWIELLNLLNKSQETKN